METYNLHCMVTDVTVVRSDVLKLVGLRSSYASLSISSFRVAAIWDVNCVVKHVTYIY